MKRFFLAVVVALFAVTAHAQTVFTTYSSTTQRIDPAAVNCASAAASRRTGWIPVAPYSAAVLDITYTDANASDLLTLTCETTNTSATTLGSGMTLPITVATAATGVASIVPSAAQNFVSTTGGNSGSFKASFRVEPRTASFVDCLLSCTGDAAAADTIGVNSRGVAP